MNILALIIKSKGMYEVNTNSGMQNQMDAILKTLNMLVNTMTTQNISLVQQAAQLQVCAICSHSDHTTDFSIVFNCRLGASKLCGIE
jgi:hypothetical protein